MRRFICTILLVLMPTLLSAGNYKSILMANDLREENRYAESLKIIVPLAQKDHLEAQLILAGMYFSAEGLQKNNNRALYWTCKASVTDDYRANKFRVKLALRAISNDYQPPQCSEILQN
jgi:TPR repeat protein